MTKVAPSLLSADLLYLADELDSVVGAGLSYVHVDVMDGRFVPNISYGANMAAAVQRYGELRFDCHLMVAEPERHVEDFARTGAEFITVHQESTVHLHRLLYRIRELGCKAGVALNPSTPVSHLLPVLPDLDLVLVMTVNPGFGGQSFIKPMLHKISELSALRANAGLNFEIQVDGGINIATAAQCVDAGADFLIAGAAFFGAPDRREFAIQLKNMQNGSRH
jgi:ribulose-phosphate 3-epimerase